MPFFFFSNDPTTTEISTLSLHDALPISMAEKRGKSIRLAVVAANDLWDGILRAATSLQSSTRSEEHTSELQSLTNLVCRLLLEKKKKTQETQNKETEEKIQKDR